MSELVGLSATEVAARVERGEVNGLPPSSRRPLRDIVRGNVFTPFNALLIAMFLAITIVGSYKDSIFIWVVILNAGVGIVQEVKARKLLDELSLVEVPHAQVLRDGAVATLDVSALVLDDVVNLSRGDQVPVDAEVLLSNGLEVDESLLTGEADSVVKAVGDHVLSGSAVVAGTATIRATAVGESSYARSLTDEARRFGLAHSELRTGANRILRMVTIAAVPIVSLLLWSQVRATKTAAEAVAGTVAGAVAMVPEGLVLLTSIAFAAGVVRLGRRKVLTRELAAIEGLARVDVVCIDKTGTLTEPGMRVVETIASEQGADLTDPLAALGAQEERPNPSSAAIAEAFPNPPAWAATVTVPFSSARLWSGATFTDQGTWLLGAPEVILVEGAEAPLQTEITAQSAQGRRVLLLAHSDTALVGEELPSDRRPVGIVALFEQVKSDVATTIGYFTQQGIAVKVISGDNPVTVTAVAARAGVPDADRSIDARTLPTDPEELGALLEANTVFGRVTPQQKRSMVHALQARGHTVAMTGDGVNDLLALKDADVGVAMGAGSPATRAVAQFVLLDGSFAGLPAVVGEGRRVIANIERLANLFVTKTVYALLLALATGIARVPFPFLPRQLSVVGSLTIGIPAFFLALEENTTQARPGFVRRVLGFAVPAGLIAATATFSAYADARAEHASIAQARTTSTVVLFIVALWVLTLPIRPLNHRRRALLAAIVASFVALITVPFARRYLEFHSPPRLTWFTALPIAAAGCAVLEFGSRWLRSRR